MKRRLDHRGFLTLSVIEAIIVLGMATVLLLWFFKPLRTFFVSESSLGYELQQRQEMALLNPIIEDIRGATASSLNWTALDPAQVPYNPGRIMWFQVPSAETGGAALWVCYDYDEGSHSLVRIWTITEPTFHADCSKSVSGANAQTIASGLLNPDNDHPIFRGNADSKTIYVNLRVPSANAGVGAGALPNVLSVSRIATVRN